MKQQANTSRWFFSYKFHLKSPIPSIFLHTNSVYVVENMFPFLTKYCSDFILKEKGIYIQVWWRSCSVAAGAVGKNTKQGLLENRPAVEAAGPGHRTPPHCQYWYWPLENIPIYLLEKAYFIDFVLLYCKLHRASYWPLRRSSLR